MKKRIISIITVLSVLFSVSVYANTPEQSVHELDLSGYDTFIQTLSDIDIDIPVAELDKAVTKGEYLEGLSSLMGYSQTASGYDIAQSTYRGEINVAYAMGWISLTERDNINPDEEITLKEATRWMLNALGYGVKVGLVGDRDSNYYAEAGSLGLLSGITSGRDDVISYSQMLKLFYNSLEINMIVADIPDGFYEGETLLYEKHDIEVYKGIVTANAQSSIAGKACGEGNLEIDGVVYECRDEKANLYIGMYVHYLVRDGIVLSVFPAAKRNETVVLDNEDIEEIDNLRQIKYRDEKDKIKKLDFEYPPYVLVNGSLKVVSGINDLRNLIGSNGELCAIDNDSDGLYEVLKITNYITYVADMVNYSKGIIIDHHLNEVIDLGGDRYKITVIKDGEAAEFSDIIPGSVVEIVADKEKTDNSGNRSIDYTNCEYITLVVSSGSMGGVVNSCSSEEIWIDETEFERSDYFNKLIDKNIIDDIKPGMSGAFFVNHSGKIVYFDTAVNVLDKCGFLIWGGLEEDTEKVGVRLYTSEGAVKRLELADKVKVDGRSYANNENLTSLSQLFSDYSGQTKIKNQLIIYRLNSKGLVSYIDTSYFDSQNENEDTSLRMDIEFYGAGTASGKLFTNGTYNSHGNVFTSGGYANMGIKSSNEKMFVVSGFANREAHDNMRISDTSGASDLFEVTTSSYFGTGDYPFSGDKCIMFYNVGDDNTAEYMVYYDPSLSENSVREVSGSGGVAFYAGRGRILNSAEEETDYVKLYLPGETEEKTFICRNENVLNNMQLTSSDSGSELKKGDIIRYSLNARGEISALKRDLNFADMYSSIQNKSEPLCFSGADIVSPTNYTTVIRWLGTRSNSYFTLMSREINWGGLSISEAAQSPMYRAPFKKTDSVLIYDVNNDEFSVGTLQDLFTAEECGEKATVMYVRHTVSNASIVLAYNFM